MLKMVAQTRASLRKNIYYKNKMKKVKVIQFSFQLENLEFIHVM